MAFDRAPTTSREAKPGLTTRLTIPHPSPRHQRWLKVNPGFAAETLPEPRRLVAEALRPSR